MTVTGASKVKIYKFFEASFYCKDRAFSIPQVSYNSYVPGFSWSLALGIFFKFLASRKKSNIHVG